VRQPGSDFVYKNTEKISFGDGLPICAATKVESLSSPNTAWMCDWLMFVCQSTLAANPILCLRFNKFSTKIFERTKGGLGP